MPPNSSFKRNRQGEAKTVGRPAHVDIVSDEDDGPVVKRPKQPRKAAVSANDRTRIKSMADHIAAEEEAVTNGASSPRPTPSTTAGARPTPPKEFIIVQSPSTHQVSPDHSPNLAPRPNGLPSVYGILRPSPAIPPTGPTGLATVKHQSPPAPQTGFHPLSPTMSRPNTTPAIAPQSGPLGLRAGLRFGDPDVGTQLARLHAEFGQFLSCANGAVVSAQLDLAKARKFKTEADTESERLNKRIKQLEEDGDEEKKALKTEIEDLKTKNEKLKLRFKKFRESMNFDDLDL